MKELILLESLILPKKNSFTGILKGLCLFICNTPFFFLTTDTLKTDGTEDSLHSTDESEKAEIHRSPYLVKTEFLCMPVVRILTTKLSSNW